MLEPSQAAPEVTLCIKLKGLTGWEAGSDMSPVSQGGSYGHAHALRFAGCIP